MAFEDIFHPVVTAIALLNNVLFQRRFPMNCQGKFYNLKQPNFPALFDMLLEVDYSFRYDIKDEYRRHGIPNLNQFKLLRSKCCCCFISHKGAICLSADFLKF